MLTISRLREALYAEPVYSLPVARSSGGGRNINRQQIGRIEPCRSRSKALTRFRMAWRRDGGPATLMSRAIDETGEVQPSRDELLAEKGTRVSYHNNAVQAWRIGADGGVTNVYV